MCQAYVMKSRNGLHSDPPFLCCDDAERIRRRGPCVRVHEAHAYLQYLSVRAALAKVFDASHDIDLTTGDETPTHLSTYLPVYQPLTTYVPSTCLLSTYLPVYQPFTTYVPSTCLLSTYLHVYPPLTTYLTSNCLLSYCPLPTTKLPS